MIALIIGLWVLGGLGFTFYDETIEWNLIDRILLIILWPLLVIAIIIIMLIPKNK